MSEQGRTYAAFIGRELDAERDRRKTFDARGMTVVTVSGSLTTLLAAAGAFVSGQTGFRLPSTVIWPLTVTLAAFAIAALCGIATTYPWPYGVAQESDLRVILKERWHTTTEPSARNYVAMNDVYTIEKLRKGNKRKARSLIAALCFQVAGLGALTIAIYLILRAAS